MPAGGGEPLIMPDIGPPTVALKERGYHLTIETAATAFKQHQRARTPRIPLVRGIPPLDPRLPPWRLWL